MATNPSSMLVPGDFQSTQDAIQRRRQLLDALVQRNTLGDGQTVSGHYVAPAWTQAVADVGSQVAQFFGGKKLDEETQANVKQNREGMGNAVQQYLKTREGYDKPTSINEITPEGQGGPLVEHVAGDPRKALVDAITSGYAPLQQIGMSDLSMQGKQRMTPKEIYALAGEGKYTPASVQKAALSGDTSALIPMGSTHLANGQLVSVGATDDGGPKLLGDYRDKFGSVGNVATDASGKPIMGQTNTGTGEIKFAPQGTTVNVDTAAKGANAFAVKSNEAAVQRLTDSQQQALKAQGSLGLFQNASELIKDLPGGLAAQPIQTAKRFLAMFGADDPSITSSEQVNQALKTAILDNAHIFGTGNGFTDKDREELARIVGADPSLTPQTLRYMVNKGLATSINALRSHEGLVDKLGQTDGADPAVMEAFKVPIPHFSLDADSFNYDPKTKLLTPKGAGAVRKEVATSTPASGGLTPEQQARFDYLAKKHGIK